MQADEARELAQRIVNELNEKCVLTDLEGVHLGFDPDDGYPLVEAILKPLLAHHALEARAAECDSLRLFLHMSRDHIPMLAEDCKFQICVDLKARADSYLAIRSLAERASKGAAK